MMAMQMWWVPHADEAHDPVTILNFELQRRVKFR